MTKLWKSWCFYFSIQFKHFFTNLATTWRETINAQCYGCYSVHFPPRYSSYDSYQGIDHPARNFLSDLTCDGRALVIYTRISSRRMREDRRPAWSIPLSDICSRCPRSWWMLDHTVLAPTSLACSSTWNIEILAFCRIISVSWAVSLVM